jgi:hypothetical protein
MGRRRKNTKGDLFIELAVLLALPFILNPEASKNFLISTFQVLMITLLTDFVISFLFKKKLANTKSCLSVDELNNKTRVEPKINSLDGTLPTDLMVIKADKRFMDSDDNREWSVDLINSLEWKTV